MRVRGCALAESVRFVNERIHFRLRQLRRADIVAKRQDTTGCAHLDDVRAVLHLEPHRITELVGSTGDADLDARLRAEPLKWKPVVVAMPAACAKGVDRHEHPRSDREPAGDRIAQADVDVVARTEIANGREARHQRSTRELRRT